MFNKKHHGGRREGAGRRAEGDEPKVKTSIAVDGSLLVWAADEAERRGVSRNKVIEEALDTARRAALVALIKPGDVVKIGRFSEGIVINLSDGPVKCKRLDGRNVTTEAAIVLIDGKRHTIALRDLEVKRPV
jgi:hypothetical protein